MATAATVFRDFVTDGVPSSGANKPKKREIRSLLTGYEQIISAFTSNGGLIYSSLASLNSDLAHASNTMAWVIGDAVAANNGIYRKNGSSGTGSWIRVADLPYSFVIGSDVGAGTVNAIQITTDIPVSDEMIVAFSLFEDTTGAPVTVSINGGAALTLKTIRGNDASALTAGQEVWGRIRSSDSTFRLISDQDVGALVAQAEAAAAAAAAAQLAAEAAAGALMPVTSDLTVNIPSGYSTLQAALDALSVRPVKQGVRIFLNIEAGHALTNGLFVRDGDYSHFWIVSEDAVVPLAAGFVGVSDVGFDGNNKAGNLIMGFNARMPALACVIDMGHVGASGYYGLWNCNGLVMRDCGVINAGYNGLEWRVGHCDAYRSIWDGANESGIRAAHEASVEAHGASCDGCLAAPADGRGAVDVARRSSVNFMDGRARNSGADGVTCSTSSTLAARGADFSGATGNCAQIYTGGIADLTQTNLSNGGSYGLWCHQTASALAAGAIITGNGIFDIRIGNDTSGGAFVTLSASTQTTGGAPARLADTNAPAFNVPTSRGIIFAQSGGPTFDWGEFSTTGATDGKDLNSLSVLQSSRNTTASATHAQFYNPNGLVAEIRTNGNVGEFRLNGSGSILTTNPGSPEGVVTAISGSICSDTTNGKLYIKTGAGNTGWVVVGTQT